MITLCVITPEKNITKNVNWIDVHTPKGNYVIPPGHAPMLLIIREDKPVAFCLKNGKVESIKVRSAVMSVDRTVCTILAQKTA